MAPRNLQLKRRLQQASVWSSAKKYGDTTTKHVDVILDFFGVIQLKWVGEPSVMKKTA